MSRCAERETHILLENNPDTIYNVVQTRSSTAMRVMCPFDTDNYISFLDVQIRWLESLMTDSIPFIVEGM